MSQRIGSMSPLVLTSGTMGLDGVLMDFRAWYHRPYPLAHITMDDLLVKLKTKYPDLTSTRKRKLKKYLD